MLFFLDNLQIYQMSVSDQRNNLRDFIFKHII